MSGEHVDLQSVCGESELERGGEEGRRCILFCEAHHVSSYVDRLVSNAMEVDWIKLQASPGMRQSLLVNITMYVGISPFEIMAHEDACLGFASVLASKRQHCLSDYPCCVDLSSLLFTQPQSGVGCFEPKPSGVGRRTMGRSRIACARYIDAT